MLPLWLSYTSVININDVFLCIKKTYNIILTHLRVSYLLFVSVQHNGQRFISILFNSSAFVVGIFIDQIWYFFNLSSLTVFVDI